MEEKKLKEKILEYMRGGTYKPLHGEELLRALAGQGEAVQNPNEFWRALTELEETGEVVKTRFAAYGLPERMGLIVGRMQVTAKGFGFVIPDNREANPHDLFVSPRSLNGAMNGDRVLARINSVRAGRDGNPEGEVVRIVVHANKRVVGTFLPGDGCAFVVPDDSRVGQDIYIAPKNYGGAGAAQKVVAEIIAWPTERRSAEGRVTEILGNYGDPGLEIMSVIKQKELPLGFPKAVQRAAERVPLTISREETQSRLDRRNLKIVTIDGDDTKDIDDAVYVRRLNKNSYLLGVYIADVSHYVTEGSVLDQEARERATSVYLVDRVLPMLPTRLSNGICSLNEGEDRLTLACEMHISAKDGRITKYSIAPAIINSRHRLTYNIVRGIVEKDDEELRRRYKDIAPMLRDMKELCLVLRRRRMERGSIDFDLPEQKVILDAGGTPLEIVPRERGLAERIIEEFMLAANETVARHLSEAKWPCVYRVHEEPSAEKMSALEKLLAGFQVKLKREADGSVTPFAVQQALKQLSGRPEERLANTVALRSMRQAVYSTENAGHFGLAAEFYCHFTSPIRRYPDTLVHRLLHEWMKHPKLSAAAKEKMTAKLQALAEHSSVKERDAADAERQTVEIKKTEYMAGHTGEVYGGTISGVTAFGMFVELQNGVEGLVHISSLTDDYYAYREEEYALVGEHTHRRYRLGDAVEIEVLQVSVAERRIDFIMAGESEALKERIKESLKRGAKGRKNAVEAYLAQAGGSGKKIRGGRGGAKRAKDERAAGKRAREKKRGRTYNKKRRGVKGSARSSGGGKKQNGRRGKRQGAPRRRKRGEE